MRFETMGERGKPAILFFHAMGVVGESSEPVAKFLRERYFCVLPTSSVYCPGQRYVNKEDEIRQVEDGWQITLTITDIGSDLMSVTIFMPTQDACEKIRRRFLNDPMLTYKGVFALLTGDTETVGELVSSQEDLFQD